MNFQKLYTQCRWSFTSACLTHQPFYHATRLSDYKRNQNKMLNKQCFTPIESEGRNVFDRQTEPSFLNLHRHTEMNPNLVYSFDQTARRSNLIVPEPFFWTVRCRSQSSASASLAFHVYVTRKIRNHSRSTNRMTFCLRSTAAAEGRQLEANFHRH